MKDFFFLPPNKPEQFQAVSCALEGVFSGLCVHLENQERSGPSQCGFSMGSACDAAPAENRDLWSTFPWDVPTKVLEMLWAHPRLCREAVGDLL